MAAHVTAVTVGGMQGLKQNKQTNDDAQGESNKPSITKTTPAADLSSPPFVF